MKFFLSYLSCMKYEPFLKIVPLTYTLWSKFTLFVQNCYFLKPSDLKIFGLRNFFVHFSIVLLLKTIEKCTKKFLRPNYLQLENQLFPCLVLS